MRQPGEVPFPRILPPDAAIVLDLEHQFRRFECSAPADQAALQARQLAHLLGHAQAHSAFWRQRIDAARIDPAGVTELSVLARLPPLTRTELQENAPAMRARAPDWSEGDILTSSSSGSTGRPVRVEKLARLTGLIGLALSMTEHRWFRRDPRQTYGVLRFGVADRDNGRWGPPASWFGPVGRVFVRNYGAHTVAELYDALLLHRPAYVTTVPSVLRAVALHAREQPGPPPRIQEFVTTGEGLSEETRRLARETFGARVTDCYSSEEIGQVALQCPRHDHLHVLGMNVLVEVVDQEGRPCPSGVAGRLLVTALHSHAMPLIRYEVGDVGIAGPACDCGITLPVLERIMGRTRDVVALPDGGQRVPELNLGHDFAADGVLEHRVRLFACNTLEVLLRCRAPLPEPTRSAVIARVRQTFGPNFPIVLRETDKPFLAGQRKQAAFERMARPYAR